MMKRRHVLASMGSFTAAGSLVVSSGAFSSAEVERDMNVDVVPDSEALLTLTSDGEDGDVVFGNEDKQPFTAPVTLTVENRTTTELNVDISSDDDITLNSDESVEFDIGVGEDEDVEISLDGPEKTHASLDISATATGEDDEIMIKAVRTLEIRAESSTDSQPRFTGGGRFKFDESLEGKTLRAWYFDGGDIFRSDTRSIDDDVNEIKLNGFEGVSGPQTVFAIEFNGNYYTRESFDKGSECEVESKATDAIKRDKNEFCDRIESCDKADSADNHC